MTREVKVGLVVSFSFVCLVGVVVVTKLNEQNKKLAAGAGVNPPTVSIGNVPLPKPPENETGQPPPQPDQSGVKPPPPPSEPPPPPPPPPTQESAEAFHACPWIGPRCMVSDLARLKSMLKPPAPEELGFSVATGTIPLLPDVISPPDQGNSEVSPVAPRPPEPTPAGVPPIQQVKADSDAGPPEPAPEPAPVHRGERDKEKHARAGGKFPNTNAPNAKETPPYQVTPLEPPGPGMLPTQLTKTEPSPGPGAPVPAAPPPPPPVPPKDGDAGNQRKAIPPLLQPPPILAPVPGSTGGSIPPSTSDPTRGGVVPVGAVVPPGAPAVPPTPSTALTPLAPAPPPPLPAPSSHELRTPPVVPFAPAPLSPPAAQDVNTIPPTPLAPVPAGPPTPLAPMPAAPPTPTELKAVPLPTVSPAVPDDVPSPSTFTPARPGAVSAVPVPTPLTPNPEPVPSPSSSGQNSVPAVPAPTPSPLPAVPTPSGFVPATPVAPSLLGGPPGGNWGLAPVQTGTPVPLPQPGTIQPVGYQGQTAPGPVRYRVQAPKEALFDIAQKTLGDWQRWREIATTNAVADSNNVPAGTILNLPPGAVVPPDNRP